MSYFTGEGSTTGNDQNDGKQEDDNQDFVKRVVEEKGDQWSDPQTLAKGYYSSQKYIKELESKLEESSKNDYAKELLEQLKRQAPAAVPGEDKTDGADNEDTTQTPDIERLIQEQLTKRERESTQRANLAESDRMLETAFGTEARAVVEKRAKELGLSKDDLTNMAGRSPQAFMTLIGQPSGKETNSTFKSTTSTDTFSPKERDSRYYNELRRTDKKSYYSATVQSQMLKDKIRLGDKF